MERGLLWLPLLGLFIWLAWAGWNESQKVQAYQAWAEQFDRAKYDVYAVLGQKGDRITWGKPTRKGPVDLESFFFNQVKSIRLLVNHQPVEIPAEPETATTPKGQIFLEFELSTGATQKVPFTDFSLAAKWAKVLHDLWVHRNPVS
ncbi:MULTISPECIES: hypothetical protein [Planktothricoides]|uniref:Uncharacterized protein n=2 Tax=Planktothricoides raciborskii TaxID=132608 RepID=A0AAU8JLG5_9CYAN|nr:MULTISPECIES: hypothetical protein [Planktothricoides]KOR37197.1 hypothetical protein AM228_08310 [Planktothricoides sp. SR001]MBD2542694.1 hypothetical protein [Planktothricoides raciborskii FACHB-1370]MBD2581152.1 hypothetical protein [Planktothricoides raciborskii FACHB-1261]